MRGNIGAFINSECLDFKYVITYGSEESQIRCIEQHFRKSLESRYRISMVEIDIKNAKNAVSQIQSTLKTSTSFFSNFSLVKITKFQDSLFDELFRLPLGTSTAFLINMSHSKLFYKSVQTFDAVKNALFIPCYPLKAQEKTTYITQFFNRFGIQFQAHSLRHIVYHLSDQFDELQSQLELISLYTQKQKMISEEDIKKLFSMNTEKHIDELFLLFYSGEVSPSSLYNLIENLKTDPHFIVRSFLKFTKKLVLHLNQESASYSFGYSLHKIFIQKRDHIKRIWDAPKLHFLLTEINRLEQRIRTSSINPKLELQFFWTTLMTNVSQAA